MDFRLRTKPLGSVDLEFAVAMDGGEASVSLPGGLSSGSLTLPYTLSTWDSLSQIIIQVQIDQTVSEGRCANTATTPHTHYSTWKIPHNVRDCALL